MRTLPDGAALFSRPQLSQHSLEFLPLPFLTALLPIHSAPRHKYNPEDRSAPTKGPDEMFRFVKVMRPDGRHPL